MTGYCADEAQQNIELLLRRKRNAAKGKSA
jgi:hypothetical protein